MLRTSRLRWYGHFERAKVTTTDSEPVPSIHRVTKEPVHGTRGSGRPRKTWLSCVRDDRKELDMGKANPMDRESWRACLRRQTAAKPTLVPPSRGNTRVGACDTVSVLYTESLALGQQDNQNPI